MSRKIFMLVFVSLLLLIGVALVLVSCDGGPSEKPDLIPANPDNWVNFCDLDNQGRLVVHVKNQGVGDAPASMTTVEFTWQPNNSQTVNLPTPAITAGSTVELIPHAEMPIGCHDPDCGFTITVDANSQVDESDETNNSVQGLCLG